MSNQYHNLGWLLITLSNYNLFIINLVAGVPDIIYIWGNHASSQSF